MEDRIDYFERMLADNPTRILALANEYGKAGRFEDEGVLRQHTTPIRFASALTEYGIGQLDIARV